ncbi:MAG: FAD-binding oxidoreductase [Burkholderiaceae bacterium]
MDRLSQSAKAIVVVGAGIVGATCALTLQRRGHAVTLVDRDAPGMGCSFGNGGAISPDFCVPMSMPGMLSRVPRWLTDPLGPLSLDWRHVPRALPWLMRWVAAGRPERVRKISAAMRALHAPALELYQALLGVRYHDLIEKTGQLYVWRNANASPSEEIARQLRQSHGIAVQALTPQDIQRIDPDLARGFVRGLYFPENAHTVDPLGLVDAMVDLFVQAGGSVVRDDVRSFELRNDQAASAVCANRKLQADAFVLAAGLASVPLAAQLGDRIPMQAERGYHAMLPDPKVRPRVKIGNRDQMFGLTPMRAGVRISGTVVITDPSEPADMRRAKTLLTNAKQMYPGLNDTGATFWMGDRPSTPDSLPVVDRARSASNVVYAFGHGHSGLSGAPMTGQLVANLMTGEQPGIDIAPLRRNRF